MFSDVRQGKNPREGIEQSLGGMADQLFDRMIAGPLTNGLLGASGQSGGGLLGDGLASILGRANGLSTANINATVVNVNGGVTGGGGVFGASGFASTLASGSFSGPGASAFIPSPGGISFDPASITAAGLAAGGLMRGPGTATSDSIVARLSNGEFVVRAAAVEKHLPLLHAINDDRLPAFREGGVAGLAPPSARIAERERREGPARDRGDPNVEVNVHNHAGVQVEQKKSRNERGGPRLDVTLSRMTASEVARAGSPLDNMLRQTYGLQRTTAVR